MPFRRTFFVWSKITIEAPYSRNAIAHWLENPPTKDQIIAKIVSNPDALPPCVSWEQQGETRILENSYPFRHQYYEMELGVLALPVIQPSERSFQVAFSFSIHDRHSSRTEDDLRRISVNEGSLFDAIKPGATRGRAVSTVWSSCSSRQSMWERVTSTIVDYGGSFGVLKRQVNSQAWERVGI